MKPPDLDCIEDYRRRFADPEYWRPYIAEVCDRHGLVQEKIFPQIGIPGTYPVFMVGHRWIFKFFGRLFNGGVTMLSELDAHRIVSEAPEIPIATLVAHGQLFDDSAEWSWPYMVFEFLSGDSLSTVRDRVSPANMKVIIEELGHIVNHLHSLPVPDGKFLKPTWDGYTHLLESNRARSEQRHRQWGELPDHILRQIEEFIPPVSDLIPEDSTPTFLHADLTADHILVQRVGSEWKIRALIDFGDAVVGDPLFELIALHLDLFQCNKGLLGAFLQTYQTSFYIDEIQAQKLLSLCLLHPFNVFAGLFRKHPEATRLSSLVDFALWLWRTES